MPKSGNPGLKLRLPARSRGTLINYCVHESHRTTSSETERIRRHDRSCRRRGDGTSLTHPANRRHHRVGPDRRRRILLRAEADERSGQRGARHGDGDRAVAESCPPPTLPGATQQAGTYPTEAARNEAALQAFQQVAATYPSTTRASPRSIRGATLCRWARRPEAEKAFATSPDAAGRRFTRWRTGRAQALAQRSGKYDDAIKTLTDLSAQRDGALPVDGVLMELARVYVKRRQDAGSARRVQARRRRVPAVRATPARRVSSWRL